MELKATIEVVIRPSKEFIDLFSMVFNQKSATPLEAVKETEPVKTSPPAVGVLQVADQKAALEAKKKADAEAKKQAKAAAKEEPAQTEQPATETPTEAVRPEDQEHKPITLEELRLLATQRISENKVVNEPLILAFIKEHDANKLPELDKQYYPKFKAFLTYDLAKK